VCWTPYGRGRVRGAPQAGAGTHPLRDTLQTILSDYPDAKGQPFAGHALAGFMRHSAKAVVKDALGDVGAGLLVEGSAGAGNWATVPWISVFDPAITTNATHGYYMVYLFHAPVPLPRSATPAEPTIPRLFDGFVDAAPALPTARASAVNEFRGSITRL